MRLGVFGGSFDPVHVGHLIVAEAAADVIQLEKILFVPARVQPFKIGQHSASAEDRVAMLQLAIEENPRFSLDGREIKRDGPSYMVDTLRELHSEKPRDELFLLVGADAAWDLPRWHDAEKLSRYAKLIALSRPGFEIPEFEMISRAITVPAISLSATHVRRSANSGGSLRYLLPTAVVEYIESNGLYGSTEIC
ncbi:nicotinate-nucleotide adenylyltransferase [Gemmatimonadota bacterium]